MIYDEVCFSHFAGISTLRLFLYAIDEPFARDESGKMLKTIKKNYLV